MIAPTPFFADRGGHVRIYEQARALAALGHQVAVCTYHLGRTPPGMMVYRSIPIPWYRKLSAGPSWHKIYLDGLLFLKSLAIARRFRPDVIHGHLHEGAAIGAVLGKLHRWPVVGDFQGSLTGELRAHQFVGGRGLLFRLLLAAERWIDGWPQVAVASCSDVATELRTRFGVPHVLPALDGVDTDIFDPAVDPGDLRSLVPAGRRAVVYLGLLNTYQGVDLLLEAVPQVLVRVPEAHFLIMGYPNVEHYTVRAQTLGIADHVSLPGRIDYSQAARYLALGEVAVSPKVSETESNGKLYNYMAMALPTVAFETPVNREILGDLGVYAPRGDAAALADRIANLLQAPEQAQALGRRLRQRALEGFSWHNTAQCLLEAYARAASLKGAQ